MSLVSIVMPLYNTEERYLRCAIESVLSQTYTNFELIIVCDKPTDDSERIAEEYAAIDSRIVVLKNAENCGVAKTLNNGLKVAKGEYIARMDADDISPSDRLRKQVSYLSKHNDVDIVFMKRKVIDENGKIQRTYCRNLKRNEIVPTLFLGCLLCHPSVMFRRSIVPINRELYDPTCRAEDYDLWTRMAIKGVSFAQINSRSFLYRVHSCQTVRVGAAAIQEASLESLHRLISACDIVVTKETLRKYLRMMTSFDDICEKDRQEGLTLFKQILSCELLKKHNPVRLRWRKRIMQVARWLSIKQHR